MRSVNDHGFWGKKTLKVMLCVAIVFPFLAGCAKKPTLISLDPPSGTPGTVVEVK